MIHPQFTGIVRAFRAAGMGVGVCTNATTLTDGQIGELAAAGGVHVNVSLDGFRPESHGRFRGDRGSFAVTVATVRKLAAAGLLQGLLCTPNSLAEDEEYRELCAFAAASGAAYVLMNPLSSMGRGVRSRGRLAGTDERMRRIHDLTSPFSGPGLEIVHIKFPNDDGLPLAGCEAGTIIYVFTGGDVTVCPYLVFAARTPQSRPASTSTRLARTSSPTTPRLSCALTWPPRRHGPWATRQPPASRTRSSRLGPPVTPSLSSFLSPFHNGTVMAGASGCAVRLTAARLATLASGEAAWCVRSRSSTESMTWKAFLRP